jgi:hypothetical protein
MILIPARLDGRGEGGRKNVQERMAFNGLKAPRFRPHRGIAGSFWLWPVAKLMMIWRGHGGFRGVTGVQLIKEWI